MNSVLGFRRLPLYGAWAILGMLALASREASAVPSFSRQTGLACGTCHTVPPQLTSFGRFFKMNGYVLSANAFNPPTSKSTPTESIGSFPPLSAMIQVADTWLNKAQPGTQNNSVAFPQQLSLFYAGRVATNMGAFVQITYDGQSDHFSLDNTDLRYARNTALGSVPVLWGLTLNNNPTVEDPWNSTPAWGFPFVGSSSAPGPAAAPLVTVVGQQVAGLGAYAWIDNRYYSEFAVYRSAQVGQPLPLDGTAGCAAAGCVVSGLAPYWRLAWQHDWNADDYTQSVEAGTFGYIAHLYPKGVTGPTDQYQDLALDGQYQLLLPNFSSLTVHAAYIHENQKLNATFAGGGAANPNHHLDAWSINAQYYWSERYGPSLGYFQTNGSPDPLLYGNRTGSPDSRGWILQWTYLPAQNVQLGAQYTLYTRFDGASSNFDGNGRNAADNDTLYLFAWLLW